MAIDEELVDLDEAVAEEPYVPMDVANPLTMMDSIFFGPSSFLRVTESGVWGDPTKAMAERGEESYDMITEAVTNFINTFQNERERIYKRSGPSDDELF